MSTSIDLPGEGATIALGRRFAEALPERISGWTVLLSGDLGSGKSTFARALIGALGHNGPVPSPTYSLVEPYTLDRGTVYHVDLYRVADPGELYFLGWDDLDTGLRLVEWPDRAPGIEASADLAVDLDYAADGRVATIRGLTSRGADLARALTV
ncbi:MAG: tRNA (adenosine(37)-N6)-threonylcarbamoyltransferase complex ATPase subunit type 1 TsaE [Pseudomonadota bacterium]